MKRPKNKIASRTTEKFNTPISDLESNSHLIKSKEMTRQVKAQIKVLNKLTNTLTGEESSNTSQNQPKDTL